jgi:RimJ/RimL family protein N-acetyltransferase
VTAQVLDRPVDRGLVGRRVRLERLSRRHIPAIHAVVTADDAVDDWPLCGQKLAPPQLEAYLWRQSQLQFAVVRRDTDDTIGLVQAVEEDRRNGMADLAVVVAPELWRAGWPLEGAILLANHMFDVLGFRKLYFSMHASTRGRLGGGLEAMFALECTFTRHLRRGDSYEDLHVFALHRDRRDTPGWRLLSGRHR